MKASGQDQPAQFLLDVIGLLHQSEIPYAIVGAVGVSYYGIPRATTDGDAAVWLGGTGKSMFAGGPQDVIDARGILQVSADRLDMDLLRKLARRYGADAARTLESLLKETL
jgi:hypothetical protein